MNCESYCAHNFESKKRNLLSGCLFDVDLYGLLIFGFRDSEFQDTVLKFCGNIRWIDTTGKPYST